MKQLTNEQIAFILENIEKGNITSTELKNDLLDHFCCVIEEKLNDGMEFNEAYQSALQIICPEGLAEIEQETIYLLTSKSIIMMKKSVVTFGIIAVITATIGATFKMFHMPAANLILIVSALCLVFGFLPSYFMNTYKQDLHKHLSAKKKNLYGYISFSIIIVAIIFKLFHVPATNLLFIVGFLLLNFGYLPYLFFKKYRKVEV